MHAYIHTYEVGVVPRANVGTYIASSMMPGGATNGRSTMPMIFRSPFVVADAYIQIKKGQYISCEQVLCQMDPAVFGPDAREFNPRRFVDNPELKKKVRKNPQPALHACVCVSGCHIVCYHHGRHQGPHTEQAPNTNYLTLLLKRRGLRT